MVNQVNSRATSMRITIVALFPADELIVLKNISVIYLNLSADLTELQFHCGKRGKLSLGKAVMN